ncbi:MAG: SRPBCC domain-containing protein [Steroidobacteraceae bacterium]
MTSLVLIRRIRARPTTVFEAMTSAEGIVHWWGPDDGPVLHAETDVRVGGRFSVRFRKLDGSEHESRGEYLELVESRRIVMSWQWTTGGPPEEAGVVSRVEIDLKPIEIGTELTFTHALLTTEESRDSHKNGWAGALEKLARQLGASRAANVV